MFLSPSVLHSKYEATKVSRSTTKQYKGKSPHHLSVIMPKSYTFSIPHLKMYKFILPYNDTLSISYIKSSMICTVAFILQLPSIHPMLKCNDPSPQMSLFLPKTPSPSCIHNLKVQLNQQILDFNMFFCLIRVQEMWPSDHLQWWSLSNIKSNAAKKAKDKIASVSVTNYTSKIFFIHLIFVKLTSYIWGLSFTKG